MTDAESFIARIWAAIFRPTPQETIWQWAERRLKIPSGPENPDMQGQPWSSDFSPYVREIMEWFRAPGKQTLIVRKSSQVGLTQACLIVICWAIDNYPVNIGYFIDSADEAKKISKGRLLRWIKDNRLVEGDVGEESDEELTNMAYYLKGMMVHLLGTHSKGAFRNKQLGWVILDELDAHPPVDGGTSWDVSGGRVKASRHGKRIGFSTPKTDDGQTETGYLLGTQERYFVPCPHCGHMQPLEWGNVVFTGEEFDIDAPELELVEGDPDADLGPVEIRHVEQLDLRKVRAKAWYRCELAGCRIEHGERFGTKFQMMLHGEWRATNPKAAPSVRSMTLSDLYSNFVSWGELAVEWIAAKNNIDKLRAFINERLGEPFRQATSTVRDKDITDRCQSYRRGTCPINPAMLALLVDVQKESFKWMTIGYSRDAGDMYVVSWGEAASWEQIVELAYEEIPCAGGEMRRPDVGLIDEGDGNRMKEVRAFTLLHHHLFPVKGSDNEKLGKELVRPSYSWIEGVKITTYHINDHVFKSELLFGRIKRAEKATRYNTGTFNLPSRITEELVDELMAEKLEEVKDRWNKVRRVWVKKKTNDWLDCAKYGCALWTIMEPALRENAHPGGAPAPEPSAP